MFCKTAFRVGLCMLLLTIASCSAPEAVTPRTTPETTPETTVNDVSGSEVIISLGDKKLTMQQIEWMQPGADKNTIARIADWWLGNELLYAEAERRGITREPKAKFLAELMRKKSFVQQLTSQVRDAVEISDEKVLAYYEENKETDPRLKQPGYLSFSHIRTKTQEQAQAALERIKAGEDINELAKELSIYSDAKKGGVAKKYMYKTVKRRFGDAFFSAMTAAKKNDLIGPVKTKDNAYEIARLEGKTEPKILPFEKVKDRIKARLERTEKSEAFKSLLDTLKEKAADKIVRSPRAIQTGKPDVMRPRIRQRRNR